MTEEPTSTFVLHTERHEVPLNSVGKAGFTAFITAGITNPFGPTLNVLTLDGDMTKSSGQVPILQVMLNPFRQTCHVVGTMHVTEQWAPEDLQMFFGLPFGNCPTLLVRSSFMPEDFARRFYGQFLRTFPDGRRVLDAVRRHPLDPWNRIQEEVAAIDSSLKAALSGDTRAPSQRLSETDAEGLATDLMAPVSVAEELRAFLAAWDGSIEFQGGTQRAGAAMPTGQFLEIFARLAAWCELPARNQ